MNIRKYIAPTAREALREIRNELGEEAVILSNRTTPQGVEIVAMNSEDIAQLSGSAANPASMRVSVEAPVARPPVAKKLPETARPAAQAVEKAEPVFVKPVEPSKLMSTGSHSESLLLGEIKSMHSKLQRQIETLSWNNVQQRDPQRATLLRRLLNAGFSTLLARQMLDKLPSGDAKGELWIKQVLKRNVRVAKDADDIVAKGGAYALIGPTGVGQTTTTAKLAARAVVRYGADKVALLTTDSYRIGAYEQLKIYGKILGVAVHAVKGTDDLRLTLSALRHKHLVLIDTVGMGQRDERVSEQNEMFDEAGVARILVLNATSSGDTLEDVVRMYHNSKVIGCIATKLDEAVNLGALLDVVVRHRLMMHFMANGQRVPEDLHPVNVDVLLHRAFKPVEEKSPYALDEMDFPMVMAGMSSEVSCAL
jgi:flagellar biosynthesis protein FlhF